MDVVVDTDADRHSWSTRVTGGVSGHHAIAIKYGGNNMVKRWQVSGTYINSNLTEVLEASYC